MPRPRRAAALALVVLTGPVACGGDEANDSGGAAGDAAEGSTPRSSVLEIDVSLAPVDLPASFPGEVPLPADVVYQEAAELAGATTTIYDITGWYDGEPIPIAREYLASLESAGFEVTSRTEAPNSLLFIAVGSDWFVSAGFYPDPIRGTGTLVGITVGPAAAAPPT